MIKSKQRESGIELLKIFAMILIVICHVSATLVSENPHYAANYLYDYKMASSNIQSLILACILSFGPLGNLMFFVCSAWFLLESKDVNTKKLMHMISDVWIINIIILVILEFSGGTIFAKDVIKSIFPTIFATNWYITCYVLFYLIHLMLNRIINGLTQKQLLSADVVALILYFGLGYLKNDLFFPSELILFIVVYFTIAYVKKYMKNFCVSRKKNIFILVIGAAGTPVMILLTNMMGMRFSFFSDKLTHWAVNASPFFLLTAIALFNLMKSRNFTSNIVNKISSLSLLIYIIHENFLISQYVRPQLWIYIHDNYGYENIVLWTVLLAIIIFVFALIASFLYKIVLQKFVYRVSDKLYAIFSKLFEKVIMRLMEIN